MTTLRMETIPYKDRLETDYNIIVVNMGHGWVWYEKRLRGASSQGGFKTEKAAWKDAAEYYGLATPGVDYSWITRADGRELWCQEDHY